MIHHQIGAAGKIKWYLLDPKTKKVLRKGRHKNLLVNNMRNSLHTLAVAANGSAPARPSYWSQRNELVVGDNAAAPALTDTALANQIGSTTLAGSFSQVVADTGTKETSNNRLKWTSTIRKVYAFPSTQNIREIGFKDTAGNLTIRFLPLDGSSNPTTITGNAGQELVVEHTLELTTAWPATVPTTSFNIGATLYNVEYTVFATTTVNIENVFQALLGTLATRLSVAKAAMPTTVRDPAAYNGSNFDQYPSRLTVQTYVSGSGQRVRQGNLGTGESNVTLYGAIFGELFSGIAVKFLSPATYVKTSANQLTIPFRSEVTLNASA